MSLLSGRFAAFVIAVALVHGLLRGRRARNVLLVVASLAFYACVAPRGLPVLLGSALWGYGSGRLIERSASRGRVLAATLAGFAGVWLAFKYLGFLVGPASAALGLDPGALSIAMPAGLSFWVLAHASYPVDVYWGNVRVRRDLVDWLAFATFFPLLLAGPIERASKLLPQVEADRVVGEDQVRSALALIAWGAVQKVVVADTLRIYVDAVYAIDRPAPIVAWAGALGFLVQLLADFAGLSNLARGIAKLFGFEVTRNFVHPYLADTPSAFWTHWHVSLSEWLRSYIFFPVYRSGFARTWLRLPQRLLDPRHHDIVRAIVATMMVSALWHGTGWNFLLWGAMWAGAQIVERLTPDGWTARLGRAKRPAQLLAMWSFNLVAHQVFREPTMARVWTDATSLPWQGTGDDRIVAAVVVAFAASGIAILSAGGLVEAYVAPRLARSPARLTLETTGACLAAWAVFVFGSMGGADFVYFKF